MRVDTLEHTAYAHLVMPNASAPSGEFPTRKHPHLYEINTWAWLECLSRRAGKPVSLDAVPDSEWDNFAQIGFNVIWLMGVWKRSEESRRIALADPANRPLYDQALPGWKPTDVIGSPYAVADYVPDPRVGTWETLDRVREKLHARGMALFLDFVSNHTAIDHPWTRERPEFHVQGTEQDFAKDSAGFFRATTRSGDRFLARGRDPYFPPWPDSAQINHFHPGARAAQIATLKSIANHCDGVRCDMAMLLLNDIFRKIWSARLKGLPTPREEFWLEAHAAVPNLILLAESYWGTEQRLLDLGFSFAYDKELYDTVRAARIDEARARLGASMDYQSRLARFLENHDEARRAIAFPNERLQAAGTLMGTLPGMRFYNEGELEGRRIFLPTTLRIAADEPLDIASRTFFQKILAITNDEIFHSGRWDLLEIRSQGDATSLNLIAYEWRSEKSWKLIALNLAASASQGRIPLGKRISPARNYVFNDELNGVSYPRGGGELYNVGLFVRLEAGRAHVFDVTIA